MFVGENDSKGAGMMHGPTFAIIPDPYQIYLHRIDLILPPIRIRCKDREGQAELPELGYERISDLVMCAQAPSIIDFASYASHSRVRSTLLRGG